MKKTIHQNEGKCVAERMPDIDERLVEGWEGYLAYFDLRKHMGKGHH